MHSCRPCASQVADRRPACRSFTKEASMRGSAGEPEPLKCLAPGPRHLPPRQQPASRLVRLRCLSRHRRRSLRARRIACISKLRRAGRRSAPTDQSHHTRAGAEGRAHQGRPRPSSAALRRVLPGDSRPRLQRLDNGALRRRIGGSVGALLQMCLGGPPRRGKGRCARCLPAPVAPSSPPTPGAPARPVVRFTKAWHAAWGLISPRSAPSQT